MNKTTKTLVVLIVILGGIYAIQRFTSKTSTTDTVKPFGGIDTSSINRVEVNLGREIVVEKIGGRWTITSPLRFPADPGQMSLLLTRIASNPSASVVADNPLDSTTYGLGAGAAYASFGMSNGKTIAMRIGDLTPDFNGCYVQLAGEDKILQLSTNLRTLMGQSLSNWRDRKVFHFGVSGIETIDFALGDTLYHFSHSDTSWQVNGIDVPEMKARDIVTSLLGTSAMGFIDSTVVPSSVIIDYGITLTDKEHIAGQIFKSAESEVSFGQLCLSNSANNQIYTVSSTLPATILEGLRELQAVYLTKERS